MVVKVEEVEEGVGGEAGVGVVENGGEEAEDGIEADKGDGDKGG